MAGYIDPLFTPYGPNLGDAYTRWIYADRQSNPYYDQPDKWPVSGQVTFVDRSLNFFSVANNATVTQSLNLGGGKNVIVYTRTCIVIPTTADTPNSKVLPNQISGYVNVVETRLDGVVEIESTPIVNVFGFGWSPHCFPAPERWQGNQQRNIAVTNLTGVTVNVFMTWKIAYLNTGR